MSYLSVIWTRLRRDPWMFIVWGSYPFILTYIMYLAFARDGGFQVQVGVVLPENLKTPLITETLDQRSFGPFAFEILPEKTWRNPDLLNRFSAVLEIPPVSRDDVLGSKTLTLTLWTNPREQIKPEIVKESVDLLVFLLNQASDYFHPLLNIMLNESNPTLDQVLEVSRVMYQQGVKYQPVFESLQKIDIEVADKKPEGDQKEGGEGRRLYTKIFWLIFLSNLFFFVNAFQGRFARDLEAGMLYRWRGSPGGLVRAYRDTLLAECLLGLVIITLGYAVALSLLNIVPAPLLSLSIVTLTLTLMSIGLVQLGYSLAPNYKAAQAFVGVGGATLFWLGGGMALVVPGAMKQIADYLPFSIAVKALVGPSRNLWLLLPYSLLFLAVGMIFYHRQLQSQTET